jgi:phosphohistidine phosphatase SixA
MKSLLILGHAKSSWKNPDLHDHDNRPLNNVGRMMRHRWESTLK